MFNLEERRQRFYSLDQLLSSLLTTVGWLEKYEDKFSRDGYVISVHELLFGALHTLRDSIAIIKEHTELSNNKEEIQMEDEHIRERETNLNELIMTDGPDPF